MSDYALDKVVMVRRNFLLPPIDVHSVEQRRRIARGLFFTTAAQVSSRGMENDGRGIETSGSKWPICRVTSPRR